MRRIVNEPNPEWVASGQTIAPRLVQYQHDPTFKAGFKACIVCGKQTFNVRYLESPEYGMLMICTACGNREIEEF